MSATIEHNVITSHRTEHANIAMCNGGFWIFFVTFSSGKVYQVESPQEFWKMFQVIPYRKVKRESVKFVMLRCQVKTYPQKMTPLPLYTLVEKQREDEVLELLLKHWKTCLSRNTSKPEIVQWKLSSWTWSIQRRSWGSLREKYHTLTALCTVNWKQFLTIVAVQLSMLFHVRRRTMEKMWVVINKVITTNSKFSFVGNFDPVALERVIERLWVNCCVCELNEPFFERACDKRNYSGKQSLTFQQKKDQSEFIYMVKMLMSFLLWATAEMKYLNQNK